MKTEKETFFFQLGGGSEGGSGGDGGGNGGGCLC